MVAPRQRNVGMALSRGLAPWLERMSRRRLPQITGRVEMHGLLDTVEVIRDHWGVPHIYARNTADAFFAQGYVHAQDRLWQMDFQRRLASGRLAEVVGTRGVPADRWIRILGFRRIAEVEASRLPAEARTEMDAYAAGVNAWIRQGRLPVEFAILRYRPEPWTPADSLVWAKMISWTLSSNWESELLRARLVDLLGPECAAELEPSYPVRCPSVIPGGVTSYDTVGAGAEALAAGARPFTGPDASEGVGSNNWAVAGWRSATGAPLLAGDMHLPMTVPAIWYENHLTALAEDDPLDVTGISLPGAPGVVSGHNGHVAWSFTASFADVQDTYIEHLRSGEAGLPEYECEDRWHEAQIVEEEIRVRGSTPVTERVLITRHGPIIDPLAGALCAGDHLSLRWTALEPEMTYAALRAMNRARTRLEFKEALRHWASPAVNVVYADTSGEIAYQLAGRVPVRAAGDGKLPAPGWPGAYEWSGYIPFDELPHRLDPPEGYLVTANNRIVAHDYPHFISDEYATGNRAQRITELIVAHDQLDLGYMQAMQFDQISPWARVVANALAELTPTDDETAEVVAAMRAWDGRLTADSAEAVICASFVVHMTRILLGDTLGALTERYLGRGPTPVVAETSLFAQRALEWLEDQLARPDSPWYDLPNGEGRNEIMARALCAALADLRERFGEEPWSWGALHTLTFAHPLGSAEPFASLLNRGPYAVGGDGNTLWATGNRFGDAQSGFQVGPPYRFVADMGDLRNARSILAPGQSGQPGSPFYEDQLAAWFTGDYHPMLYHRVDIEREAFARLTLEPTL